MVKALSIVVIIAAVFGTCLHYRYLRTIRLRHPATWQSLRRPTLFSVGGSLMMSLPVIRFLWREEYRQIGDDGFSRLSATVRAYNIVFLLLCTAYAVFTAVRIFGSQ